MALDVVEKIQIDFASAERDLAVAKDQNIRFRLGKALDGRKRKADCEENQFYVYSQAHSPSVILTY